VTAQPAALPDTVPPEFDSKTPFFADFSLRGIANQQLICGASILM
jgi:hypothetical protein